MSWSFLILAAFIAGLIYFIKHLPEILRSISGLPYVRREALFSPAEKLFLDALEKAIDGKFKIYAKVRMSDILDIKTNISQKDYQVALNGINCKHIDFVLCNSLDASFLCGIELDDKTHNQSSRKKRDAFVDKAFEAAGLPLFRFKTKAGYNVDELREHILTGLGLIKPVEAVVDLEPAKKEGICPNCSGPMTRKKASAGENAGKIFWVCNNYQNCKTAIQADS